MDAGVENKLFVSYGYTRLIGMHSLLILRHDRQKRVGGDYYYEV